jgi:hypothetical protein
MFFDALPAGDVLSNAISVYTRLINAVTEHAIRLSRGQIEPPAVFDPGAVSPPIVEPAPIPLRRVSLPALPTIRVPSLLGLDTGELEEAGRCLSAGTVDDCLAGTVFLDQDGNPRPIPVSREVAEFLMMSINGQLTVREDLPALTPGFSGFFEVTAQFPSPGTLVATDSEVVLQFVELPIG